MLSFTSPAPYYELLDSIKYHDESHGGWRSYSEIIIILQGKAYETAEERNKIYYAISKQLISLKYKNFLHVILLTEDIKSLNPGDNLFTLTPPYQQEEPFSPLANKAGYYLSAPKIFSTIGYYIQKKNNKTLTSEWLQNVSISPKITEIVPEEEEISGYIYGREPKENVRQSKFSNKQELKSQIGLIFSLQQEMQQEMQQEVQQSQVLKQNQDLAKQQSLTQQRQHQLNEQIDDPFYTPPIPISGLFLALQNLARDRLREIPLEEELRQEMYYTYWYHSNYSEQALLKKMLVPPQSI